MMMTGIDTGQGIPYSMFTIDNHSREILHGFYGGLMTGAGRYPIYQRGNPQLRVFLPNFWMKLVRPSVNQQPNIVEFHCSMEMTKHDIKNYLEKIYDVPVVDVKTRIATGKFRKDIGKGYIVKDDDIKFAYVTLPKTMKFEFPDIFQKKKGDTDDDMKSLDEAKKSFKSFIKRNKDRSDVPSWFSI